MIEAVKIVGVCVRDQQKARGVEFVEPPTKQPWGGILAQSLDQDANRFVLVDQ